MERKREMIQALIDVAYKSVKHYSDQAQAGTFSTDVAKKKALFHVRNMRYGEGERDYFWINDKQPKLIMHPYRPDLEGRDQSQTVDPTGKRFFMSFIEAVKKNGAGFVDYQWQWQDNPDKVVPK
ncbi:MAG: two component system sensor protein, partial [Desulfobacteraceae bacterium]|nr:two component system sensor protein [Desulfobacteraceae bacterium]